jgi:succinate dehydrogenase / fumarate reductase cytochrome b subunit
MSVDTNKPTSSNWWKWFDFRARDVGTWAFILNRISALGLTIYLFLHMIVLGRLAQGPQAWEDFLKFTKNPLIVTGELLVVIGGIYHGLNGVRIGLATFGRYSPQQKQAFYVVIVVTIIASAVFAYRLFT